MRDQPAALCGNESTHFALGRQEFDAGRWWEAHEAWEEAWVAMKARQAEPKDILLMQGLIQCAALLYNHRRGTTRGVQNQWTKLQPKLEGYLGAWGVNVLELLTLIRPFALDAEACTLSQSGLRLPWQGGEGDE
jgi:hypothetical protein